MALAAGTRVQLKPGCIDYGHHLYTGVGTVDTSVVDGYENSVIFDGHESLGEWGFDDDELDIVETTN